MSQASNQEIALVDETHPYRVPWPKPESHHHHKTNLQQPPNRNNYIFPRVLNSFMYAYFKNIS